jgi:hypothetical protein
MTEGARNAVLTNIIVDSLTLLLSCCTNDRETKMLLGIPDTGSSRHLIPPPTRMTLPADNTASIPAPGNGMSALNMLDPNGRPCSDPNNGDLSLAYWLLSANKSGPSKAWLNIKNPNAPAATRGVDATF